MNKFLWVLFLCFTSCTSTPKTVYEAPQLNKIGASGIVETSSRPLMLGFVVAGKITYLAPKGSNVLPGGIIASLDKSVLLADLNLAEIRKNRAVTAKQRNTKINERLPKAITEDELEEQQLSIDILNKEIERLIAIKNQHDIVVDFPVMVLRYDRLIGEICAPGDIIVQVAPYLKLE